MSYYIDYTTYFYDSALVAVNYDATERELYSTTLSNGGHYIAHIYFGDKNGVGGQTLATRLYINGTVIESQFSDTANSFMSNQRHYKNPLFVFQCQANDTIKIVVQKTDGTNWTSVNTRIKVAQIA